MSRYPGGIITKNPVVPTGPSTYGSAPGVWRLNDVAYWTKQGLWPNPAIVPDPYFPYTSLLLSSTSLSNANNNLFVDSSGAFNPVSRNGNTTQGSFTPYGSYWSNYFDGNADWLRTTAINISSGDFTVEAWVYLNAMPTSDSWPGSWPNWMEVLGVGTAGAGDGWQFRIGQTVLAFGTNGDTTAVSATHNMVVGQWYHLAVTRSGNVYTLYKNGTSIGSATYTANNPGTGAYTWVGCETGEGAYLNGYISNARIVAGTAVYTANFTPPTTNLTAISGTSLLTCQSNRFIDNSSNAFAITVNGDTKVQKFSPFSPAYPGAVYNQSDITNWSGYFDGSGDFLSLPNSSGLQLGAGDFTIEAWVYMTSLSPQSSPILTTCSNTEGAGGVNFAVLSSGQIEFFDYVTTSRVTSGGAVATGQWTHVAACRSGSTLRLFQNGVVVATGSTTSNFTGNASQGGIGSWAVNNSNLFFNGYISNLRVVKGTAVYTAGFTPPTAPLTAISNTTLLTLQNAAFTDNGPNKLVLTPNGNPTVTGNSPFNTVGFWSNYFSSTNSYLTGNAPLSTSTSMSTFTIEGWVYPTSFSDRIDVIGDMSPTSASDTKVIAAEVNTSGQVALYWYDGAIKRCTGNTAMTLNQWNYFAIVVNSNAIAIYVNKTTADTLSGTTTLTTRTQGYNCALGKYYTSNSAICYLSNIRVSTVARTISSVPTSPLAVDGNTRILTCQANRFVDTAGTVTFTPTTVSVQSFDPFYTATIASNGGSMYFDGSGDYLETGTTGLFTLSSGNWTVQGWYYSAPYTAANQVLCSIGVSGDNLVVATIGSNGYLYYLLNNGVVISTTTAAPAGTWAYFALVKSGSTTTLYLNGVSIGTTTSVPNATSKKLRLGVAYDGTSPLNGYISNFRILTGTADTAVPTAPLTPTPNTVFLTNGMNAGIYDATTINDMETVGNAQVSTVQSKFGGSSMYFDGSGDYLTLPSSPNLGLGSGDFTIEGWIYPTAVNPTDSVIIDFRSGNSGNNGPILIIGAGSNALVYVAAGAARITGSAVALNTWSHFAVTRSGTSTRLFLNGTQTGSTYTDTNNYLNPARVWIGADDDGSPNAYFNGYIDDLRVTKGVARYTANFTPPTQPFPVY